jgi:ribosomal-protein-alanine N-acetyltransferase
MLRPLVDADFESYGEVRRRNGEWLTAWEPARPAGSADPALDRTAFRQRCVARERERTQGQAYSFGVFVDSAFVGEVNLNNVMRGAMQSGTIGYWIDKARAGNGYIAEGVVVVTRFAFDDLRLHRVEVCIIPRNHNSLRVVEKVGFRHEGRALGFLEINGVWEDHDRFACTAEEWSARRDELTDDWL